MLTLQDFIMFDRLYRRLNMSDVAKEFYMSQSSISYAVSKLEDELGVKLFMRKGKKLTPTQEGHILSHYAIEFIRLYEDMLNNLSSARCAESLYVGWSYSSQEVYSTDIIERYQRLHSGTQIFSTVDNPKNLKEMLAQGRLDVILTSDDTPDYQQPGTKLLDSKLVFCCREDAGFIDIESVRGNCVTMNEFRVKELPILLKVPPGELDRTGMLMPRSTVELPPQCRIVSMYTSFLQAKYAAMRGLGAALIPLRMIKYEDGLYTFELDGMQYIDNLMIKYRRSDADEPRITDFVHFVENWFKNEI